MPWRGPWRLGLALLLPLVYVRAQQQRSLEGSLEGYRPNIVFFFADNLGWGDVARVVMFPFIFLQSDATKMLRLRTGACPCCDRSLSLATMSDRNKGMPLYAI